jgi:hypothetical protein
VAFSHHPRVSYAVTHGCTDPPITPGDSSVAWDEFADFAEGCGNFWGATSVWFMGAAGVLGGLPEPAFSKFGAAEALVVSGAAGMNSAYYYAISGWARTSKTDPFGPFVDFQVPTIEPSFDLGDADLDDFSSSLFEQVHSAAAFIAAVRAFQAIRPDAPEFTAALGDLEAAETRHLAASDALDAALDKGLKALDKQAKEGEFSSAIEACALSGKITCADFFETDIAPLAYATYDDQGMSGFMDDLVASFAGEVLAYYDEFAKTTEKDLKDIEKDVKKLTFSLGNFVEYYACGG